MFTQQSPPQFSQQANNNMYNGNGMNLNVSMATNSSNIGQMGNQMTMSAGPGGGMANMGPEQVRHTQIRFWVMWHLCLWKVWMFIAFANPFELRCSQQSSKPAGLKAQATSLQHWSDSKTFDR